MPELYEKIKKSELKAGRPLRKAKSIAAGRYNIIAKKKGLPTMGGRKKEK